VFVVCGVVVKAVELALGLVVVGIVVGHVGVFVICGVVVKAVELALGLVVVGIVVGHVGVFVVYGVVFVTRGWVVEYSGLVSVGSLLFLLGSVGEGLYGRPGKISRLSNLCGTRGRVRD
jgi:hypothetical protein